MALVVLPSALSYTYSHNSGKDVSALKTRVSNILDRIAYLKKTIGSSSLCQRQLAGQRSEKEQTPAASGSGVKAAIPRAPPMVSVAPLASDKRSGVLLDGTERSALRSSSILHGKIFQPWLDGEETIENFNFNKPWCDPDGILPLSDKQRSVGVLWKRPTDLVLQPVMINDASPLHIVQEAVGNILFLFSSYFSYASHLFCIINCSCLHILQAIAPSSAP